MNAVSQYETITESRSADPIATSAGIALTGGYIYNALALGNLDAVENEGDTLDICMSHATPQGSFHYHFAGACLKRDFGGWSDTEAPNLCSSYDDCILRTGSFTRSYVTDNQTKAYTRYNWDDVIGLARDGHVIIGPYHTGGSTWGCSRDQCNGRFIDGSYVYVSSDSYPYVVGCWGPGPAIEFGPICSNNACTSSDYVVEGTITSGSQGNNDFALQMFGASISTILYIFFGANLF